MLRKVDKAAALSSLAAMLEYPAEDYLDNVERARELCSSISRPAGRRLGEFHKLASKHTLEELEELFTRTFEIAPVCNLYTSAYIYGDESFDRGTLMSTLKVKFQEAGFDPGDELPDHLAVLLKFATYLTTEEFNELITCCLMDPVKQMNELLKNSNGPYSALMQAISDILSVDLPRELAHD